MYNEIKRLTSTKQEVRTFAEFIGLPGLVMKSVFNSLYPNQSKGKDVYLQGSRQMDSLTRRYCERNLGAGMFVSPETENGLVDYSEPLRRFIQPEGFTPQVNEIQNTMPSWIPGEDHLINFQKGDPYTKVDEGYARLPGAGWCPHHLHLVSPPANIKIPTRAREGAAPLSAPSFSIPISVRRPTPQKSLDLFRWTPHSDSESLKPDPITQKL
jgi:hypothetical protein